MGRDQSTIQSLKSVDAWIDVINANINGGVRTAFKSSRLKFSGSNVDVARAGSASSLPLQMPEPGLIAANTIIDFSQGAITASTENTHLAIQGEGFFLVADPGTIATATGLTTNNANAKFYLTRDGEFHTDSNGLLVNNYGYYLVTVDLITNATVSQTAIDYDTGSKNGTGTFIRAVFNDIDLALPTAPSQGKAKKLSDFIAQTYTSTVDGTVDTVGRSLINVTKGKQNLTYTQFGSTVYSLDFSVTSSSSSGVLNIDTAFGIASGTTSTATVLSKSLEASNASMTQSVPELSLAQKLFSALTKVLQINATNTDAVLNLVR